jgi:ABC-type protease/lipase transport system fused ATPase/permease subunit
MGNKKIALFIFDMIIVVIAVTGLLLILGAMDEYDHEQEIKQQDRIAANKSNEETLRNAEWVLLLNKGEQTTTFKAEMK